MNVMILVFVLLLAAIVSILIAQLIPKISVNYISMIIGGLLFLIPAAVGSLDSFNSEIFMGLIIAPLLFFEGQAMRLNLVSKKLKRILQVTVSLVIITMLVGGFGVWQLTHINIALAFMLAAISTPTDATALESVTNGLQTPKREFTLLKLESLFNDASGIILLNMAALWYTNGHINVGETIINFIYSAGGGVLFGMVTAWIIILFRQELLRTSFNSLNAQNVLYVITPFLLYFAAEAIHVSGIIAVVSAGLVHNAEAQRSRLVNPPQIRLGFDLISLITEIFNSMVFVILGFMFISIINDGAIMNHAGGWLMVGVTFYLLNTMTRYVYSRFRMKMLRKDALIFALAGVHGAVTLSLAFTVAEMHIKSSEFNLVIMSACVFIVLSMLIPTIAFRFILDKTSSKSEILAEVGLIRKEMVQQALASVDNMYLPKNVKRSVKFDLSTQNERTKTRDFVHAWLEAVHRSDFNEEEQELEMRAFMNAFLQERKYLDMISQREAKYQSYVFDIYKEVLLAESLVITPDLYGRD